MLENVGSQAIFGPVVTRKRRVQMPRKDRRKIICWANNTIDESQTKGDRISHLRIHYNFPQKKGPKKEKNRQKSNTMVLKYFKTNNRLKMWLFSVIFKHGCRNLEITFDFLRENSNIIWVFCTKIAPRCHDWLIEQKSKIRHVRFSLLKVLLNSVCTKGAKLPIAP